MKKRLKLLRRTKHLKRRARRSLKRRLLIRRRIKGYRRLLQRKTQQEQIVVWRELNKFRGYQFIFAPIRFCFLDNTEQVIGFINQIDNAINKGRSVLIKLEKVKEIDYAAITVLLTVMFRFKHRHIPFNGTMPLDLDVKQKLIDSTFFKRLEKPFISRDQYEIKSTNQLYTKGSKIVDPILGYDLILAASETVWGQKRKSPGFQRVLLELMQNTLEHAGVDSDDNEFWWLSVNHDKNQKKVSFVFVDYGQGIFESLASNKPIGHKWFDAIGKVKSAFGEITNAEMLKKLLDGEIHKTVTGKAFRGKGIPGINEVMGRNQISSLRLISNDASGDVKNDIFISLNNKFRGTFLYWELCYSNASHIWNLQK